MARDRGTAPGTGTGTGRRWYVIVAAVMAAAALLAVLSTVPLRRSETRAAARRVPVPTQPWSSDPDTAGTLETLPRSRRGIIAVRRNGTECEFNTLSALHLLGGCAPRTRCARRVPVPSPAPAPAPHCAAWRKRGDADGGWEHIRPHETPKVYVPPPQRPGVPRTEDCSPGLRLLSTTFYVAVKRGTDVEAVLSQLVAMLPCGTPAPTFQCVGWATTRTQCGFCHGSRTARWRSRHPRPLVPCPHVQTSTVPRGLRRPWAHQNSWCADAAG